MRFFKFFVDADIRRGLRCDENEWRYCFRPLGKFAAAYLRPPASKDGTAGKGVLNIGRSHIYCFGWLREDGTFSGIMFYDLWVRSFIFLVCLGIGCSNGSILQGVIAGTIFYLLMAILSASKESLYLAMLRKRLRW